MLGIFFHITFQKLVVMVKSKSMNTSRPHQIVSRKISEKLKHLLKYCENEIDNKCTMKILINMSVNAQRAVQTIVYYHQWSLKVLKCYSEHAIHTTQQCRQVP